MLAHHYKQIKLNKTILMFDKNQPISQRRSSHERSCSALSPVSAGIVDRLRAGIPPWYVTRPTRSTQPCIPLGSLNRVPALIGWGKGGNVTSAGWQVTQCDPIWHVSSRSGEACCELLYPVTLLTFNKYKQNTFMTWLVHIVTV